MSWHFRSLNHTWSSPYVCHFSQEQHPFVVICRFSSYLKSKKFDTLIFPHKHTSRVTRQLLQHFGPIKIIRTKFMKGGMRGDFAKLWVFNSWNFVHHVFMFKQISYSYISKFIRTSRKTVMERTLVFILHLSTMYICDISKYTTAQNFS